MKTVAILLFTTLLVSFSPKSNPSFYDFKMKTIDGKDFDFKTLKGKKVLLVNLASFCGYTSQYEGLQALSAKYKDKLVVLGFPSNSFYQEPKDNEEIGAFCKKNYGVTFTVFEKIEVKGKEQHPLYQWLTKKELNGWNTKSPSWNFNKYLVDENGKLLNHFGSNTEPLSKEITELLN